MVIAKHQTICLSIEDRQIIFINLYDYEYICISKASCKKAQTFVMNNIKV